MSPASTTPPSAAVRQPPGAAARGCRRSRKQRGAALVMTLSIIALLTVLLLVFLNSMRTELRATHAWRDQNATRLVVQAALAHATELLRANIPDPAPIDEPTDQAVARHFASNPGRLTIVQPDGGLRFVDLHTGEVTWEPASETVADARSVDLNRPLPGDPLPAITPALGADGRPDRSLPRPQMRVAWHNLAADPSRAAGPDNPLTARYAFWMDDDTAKVNFNVALGKPAPANNRFHQQLAARFVTPLFTGGTGASNYSGTGNRDWALGQPRSVNLDHLVPAPLSLDRNRILDHFFLHGFARYPEGVIPFINGADDAREDWFRDYQYQLSHAGRAPEFNAFGRARMFTTYAPLSLEAGPAYTHPFQIEGPGGKVFNMPYLLGRFGWTTGIPNDPDGHSHADGVVNQQLVETIMGYFHRPWPGYSSSFVDKYGEKECHHLALNILHFARLKTTMMSGSLGGFTSDWAWRTTSVNYTPPGSFKPGATPERHYWRFTIDGEEHLFLPQVMGPFITEVRLIVRAQPADIPPYNDPNRLAGFNDPHYITYRIETEYHMPEGNPVVQLQHFPMRTDYLELDASGAGRTLRQQFGPDHPSDTRAARNWNHSPNMARLRNDPSGRIGPANATFEHQPVPDRVVVSTPERPIGFLNWRVPAILGNGTNFSEWEPAAFDAARGSHVEVDFKFRVGMSILNSHVRPRQMIPLGETSDDTLEGSVRVNLTSGEEEVLAWEIDDPRLSHLKHRWVLHDDDGTPGEVNSIEPPPGDPRLAKAGFIQRGPNAQRVAGHGWNRPDEYNSRSRTSSVGYWSFLHTGLQNDVPWRTLDLGSGADTSDPPDAVLLDLFGPTYPMQHDQWRIEATLPDRFSTASFMNSTAGAVNLNTRVFPRAGTFQAPERTLPLEAVFLHLRPEPAVRSLVDNLRAAQSDQRPFLHVGDLANVPGYRRGEDASPWENEELLRNMAGLLTTNSNTFTVWGVAQTVRKARSNDGWDEFEPGDRVLAEQRFMAVIERHVWPGQDGAPGNAHVDDTGRWDRKAVHADNIDADERITDTLFELPGSPPLRRTFNNQGVPNERLLIDPSGSYAEFDGPQPVSLDIYAQAMLGRVIHQHSPLEEASNPPHPLIRYRLAYFRLLNQ